MGNEEARGVATYMIVRRGSGAFAAALDHAARLKAVGRDDLAAFWGEIATEVTAMEADEKQARTVTQQLFCYSSHRPRDKP
ncbi:MAG: hypothetical protein JOZ72_13940 [Alphaproteobacteria bacterium]|nr:hypothetical protein [Alphaproteobacteria bacterium]